MLIERRKKKKGTKLEEKGTNEEKRTKEEKRKERRGKGTK